MIPVGLHLLARLGLTHTQFLADLGIYVAAFGSNAAAAEALGCTASMFFDVAQGERRPSPAMLGALYDLAGNWIAVDRRGRLIPRAGDYAAEAPPWLRHSPRAPYQKLSALKMARHRRGAIGGGF